MYLYLLGVDPLRPGTWITVLAFSASVFLPLLLRLPEPDALHATLEPRRTRHLGLRASRGSPCGPIPTRVWLQRLALWPRVLLRLISILLNLTAAARDPEREAPALAWPCPSLGLLHGPTS